jgi:hypothetical protein
MKIEIPRRLNLAHAAALMNQPNRFNLEFLTKYPSCQIPPPVSSNA